MQQQDTVDRATIQRVEKGWVMALLGKIEKDGPLFMVKSSTGRGVYAVNLDKDECECKDWMKRKTMCKHLVAATIFSAKNR